MFRKEVDIGFRHLERMTDDTGLLEHSLGALPRRAEGYATDDNARALWMCLLWQELLPEADGRSGLLQRLAERYAAFLLWAQDEDGRFHNNFRYDRSPEPETPSDDCLGRSLWAAACARVQSWQPALWLPAEELLKRGIGRIGTMRHLRGYAYALAACSLLLRAARQGKPDRGDRLPGELVAACERWADELEQRLLRAYETGADRDWRWFEPAMTYGNGLLPWGLLWGHAASGRRRSLDVALASLDFLTQRMQTPQGWIRPVGNRGWATREESARWDQQPLEALKLALAAREAYGLTGRAACRETVKACRRWFYGYNDAGAPLADAADGSCADGLSPDGPSANRGAEAMLAYLLTEAIYLETEGAEKRVGPQEPVLFASVS